MTDNRTDYINGLRQLADFLTNNPTAPIPLPRINVCVFANAKVTAFGNLDDVQLTPTADDEGNLAITVMVGSIEYYVYGYANWDEHRATWEAKQARDWADKNGMQLVRADAEERWDRAEAEATS